MATPDDFPGPHCKKHGLNVYEILHGCTVKEIEVTNGIVLELRKFSDDQQMTLVQFVKILEKLNSDFEGVNPVSVNSKLMRVQDQRKKLVSKKKVKGIRNVEELLNKKFESPNATASRPVNISAMKSNETQLTNEINATESVASVSLNIVTNETNTTSKSTETQTDFDCGIEEKDLNLLTFRVKKLEKQCLRMDRVVQEKKETEKKLDCTIGHYSVRNVNKRDKKARENLNKLRFCQRKVISCQRQLKHLRTLVDETKLYRNENEKLEKELKATYEQLKNETSKKVSLQKNSSYLRKDLTILREKLKTCEISATEDLSHEHTSTVLGLRDKIDSLQSYIDSMESEKEDNNDQLQTKNDDGSYTNNLRMCVMELAGLEVAVEKVVPVIESVCRNLLMKTLKDTPNSSTIQTIVDEGHFVAKTFITHKLNDSTHWGLCRDGTTRKKRKLVDTSITLDSGDIISLGFDRVNHESAATIHNVTKKHLNELGTIQETLTNVSCENFVAQSLEKLAFTMSDRASNEKLANQLLDDWRADILKDNSVNVEEVHHFHCMAHTLLGFHNYTIKPVKEVENKIEEPFGRNTLPVFKNWKKSETCVERIVRTASDVFGPSGDYNGVRDKWDSYCAANGVKSIIGNYKDNRFNGIFETSAQVFCHHDEFKHVLSMIDKKNLKLQSVEADLKSTVVMDLVRCFGLFFVKVTGPFWNLIMSGDVPYLELSSHVQDLKCYLEQCGENPDILLDRNSTWTSQDHHKLTGRLSALFDIQEDNIHLEIIKEVLSVMASACSRCISKQLCDFLEGGKYFGTQPVTEIKRTNYSGVTNLGCEHHFGDLDSSQRRRPNASMHHHSSVQLLKRNRKQMFEWLHTMKENERDRLLVSARKGGKMLRFEHRDSERKVLEEIHEELLKGNGKEKKKRDNKRQKRKRQEESEDERIDQVYEFQEQSYVAIAYQDTWYPGIVTSTCASDQTATVRYMTPCRKPGYFKWPIRDDVQKVSKKFILFANFTPDCVNNGRQWYVKDHNQISEKFDRFKDVYF